MGAIGLLTDPVEGLQLASGRGPRPFRRRGPPDAGDRHCNERPESERAVTRLLFPTSLAVATMLLISSAGVRAATLITEDEARRPAVHLITETEAREPVATLASEARGITRAPTISLELPQKPVPPHKPFEFKVELKAHGGATIDPAKVHVTYLKEPGIDLTDRLRPFVTADGIDMPNAEVPTGTHPLRIDVEDSDGRISHAVITLAVAKS